MDNYRVQITFTEPLLGTVALNKELYRKFIASKAPAPEETADEEVATVEERLEKVTTGFHRVDGQPVLYDYLCKGFFKGACGALARVKGTQSNGLKAYKKVIDTLVFIRPRRIPLLLTGQIAIFERPLRAQTPQGERVAIARSEQAPAGSSIEFTVQVLGVVEESLLREWLDYGQFLGLGQWRSGGWGSFAYTMERA